MPDTFQGMIDAQLGADGVSHSRRDKEGVGTLKEDNRET